MRLSLSQQVTRLISPKSNLNQNLVDLMRVEVKSLLPPAPQIVNAAELISDQEAHNQPKSIELSPRESAIAKLVAQGLPNKVIAKQLKISPWTVASHLRRIFLKVGVTSRTAMIVKLLDQHLL